MDSQESQIAWHIFFTIVCIIFITAVVRFHDALLPIIIKDTMFIFTSVATLKLLCSCHIIAAYLHELIFACQHTKKSFDFLSLFNVCLK